MASEESVLVEGEEKCGGRRGAKGSEGERDARGGCRLDSHCAKKESNGAPDSWLRELNMCLRHPAAPTLADSFGGRMRGSGGSEADACLVQLEFSVCWTAMMQS